MTEPVVTGVRERAVVQADFCKVFGNVQRLMILWSLVDSELSVGDIAKSVNGSLQNTSQHLHLMKNKGRRSRPGWEQTIYYCIAKTELMKNCPLLLRSPQMDVFWGSWGGYSQQWHYRGNMPMESTENNQRPKILILSTLSSGYHGADVAGQAHLE